MCVLEITPIASVVFERGTDIPTDLAMGGERGALIRGEMSDDAGADWSDGRLVEIEVAVERGVSGKGRVNAGRA
jgi:hypothetical protein